MDSEVQNATNNENIALKKANILIYSIVAGFGFILGLFFSVYFTLLKPNFGFFIINNIIFVVGLITIISLYIYTGNINEQQRHPT